jgi:hypothetical protein
MNCYAYRIHEQDDPQRIGHVAMNSDEVHAALRRFHEALPQYLRELNASAELPEPLQRHCSAIRVLVHTELDWALASRAMNSYADRHGLRATRVLRSPSPGMDGSAARKGAGSWLMSALGGALATGK